MKFPLSANQTSARHLMESAFREWGMAESTVSTEMRQRHVMMVDLYIKARSYAVLNKLSFVLAILAGIMVLAWPSLAVISKDYGLEKDFLKSAIVQTTVTGLAALTYGVYSHYKKRQMYVENLMRYVFFTDDSTKVVLKKVMKEIERIDAGFVFSESAPDKDVTRKEDSKEESTEKPAV